MAVGDTVAKNGNRAGKREKERRRGGVEGGRSLSMAIQFYSFTVLQFYSFTVLQFCRDPLPGILVKL
jgi:hypothetical protein